MHISLNWLKEFVDIEIDENAGGFSHVVVGLVKRVTPHPDADRLNIAEVDIGQDTYVKIVCGGTNLKANICVPVALPGAVLPEFTIEKRAIRGVESHGMICHLSELGIGKPGNKEISILKKTTPGTPFKDTLPHKGMAPTELAELLTRKTAEVEKVEHTGKAYKNIVVGEILEYKKHQNAEKLHIAKVNIGKKKPIQVIFGQMVQMHPGDKVPVAIAPTTLPTGMTIEKKEFRGELTEGMLCLDQELGLAHEGVSIRYFPTLSPGTPLAEALDLDDIVFEIDNKSLTHRPDLWGHYGFAREVAALTNKKLKPLAPSPEIPQKGESIAIDIESTELCPRYCGLIIKNVTVAPSPEWLAKKLRTVGHGTHNNIVDITNYVMAELGQPMHAFDYAQIEKGIIVRTAKKGEKIKTLEGKTHALTEEMLIIADYKKPLAVAGVIGGEHSGISENTTTIVLESANFHAASVRRTSARLGIRTDAVQRFEKSLDPHLAELAIRRAAELILKVCPGAQIAGPLTDVSHFKDRPLKVTLDLDKVRSKIGVPLSDKEIISHLEKLEFIIKKSGTHAALVTVPSFRATKDVDIEDDLIEEVARMYGYDNIPAELPALPARLPLENRERFTKHRLRELLSLGLGFDEVYNYSFYGKDEISRCLLTEDGHYTLLNHLASDQTHLRTTPVPHILKNIQDNIRYHKKFRLYEIGRTYKDSGEYYPHEEKIICGATIEKGKSPALLYEAKGAVETILSRLKIPHTAPISDIQNAPYAHPTQALTWLTPHGTTLAQVFMLHPTVLNNYDLKPYSIALFTLNFTELAALPPLPTRYTQLPKFPSITLDVSVIVDQTLPAQKLHDAIKQADPLLITEITLFDLYEGKNLPSGKKSLAFTITLQSPDRTLTDKEMTTIQATIFKHLEALGGEIRKS